MLALTAALALTAGGGSVLIPSNVAGYVWTIGPVVIAVLVLGWPRIDRGAGAR